MDTYSNSLPTVSRALLKHQACVVVFLIIDSKIKNKLAPEINRGI